MNALVLSTLQATTTIVPNGGKLQLPDGGDRLFERGEFRKVKINARKQLRAIIKSELSLGRANAIKEPISSSSSVGLSSVARNLIGIQPGPTTSSLSLSSTPPTVTIPVLPPDWQKCYTEALDTEFQYKEFPVDPQSLEFKTIVGFIQPFNVISAKKIMNRELWDIYLARRKELLKKKSNDPEVWSSLGMDENEVKIRKQRDQKFNRDAFFDSEKGQFSLNEALLCHCTSSEANVKSILLKGLDDRLGKEVGKVYLGKGIYFADNPKKSVEYIEDSTSILLFAVILGDCKDYDTGDNAVILKTEPEKIGKEKRNEFDRNYDSITARPVTGLFNEYVIYNRNQCVPLYQVKICRQTMESDMENCGNVHYLEGRSKPPNFAWKKQPFPYQFYMPTTKIKMDYEYPFFTLALFNTMDEMAHNMMILQEMGFKDKIKNEVALLKCVNFEIALKFLIENTNPVIIPISIHDDGESVGNDCISTITDDDEDEEEEDYYEDDDDEPVSKKTKMSIMPLNTNTFPCQTCTKEYQYPSSDYWKMLKCGHELCYACYEKIEIRGTTMSNVTHTARKCPVCKRIDGVIVGSCPDGRIRENIIPTSCVGYEYCETRRIVYYVYGNGLRITWMCFLPNNAKGRHVLRLLKIAWDRRLVFSSDVNNKLIWEIPHKTSQRGGGHGYPDPSYLDRVLLELKKRGVE